MDYAKILAAIPDFLQMISLLLTALVLFATVVSKVTFWTRKDDEFVDSLGAKILSFLPTIGTNARTKQLEEMIAQLKAEKSANANPETSEKQAS